MNRDSLVERNGNDILPRQEPEVVSVVGVVHVFVDINGGVLGWGEIGGHLKRMGSSNDDQEEAERFFAPYIERQIQCNIPVHKYLINHLLDGASLFEGVAFGCYGQTPAFPLGTVMSSLPALQQLYRQKGFFFDALVSYKRQLGSTGVSFNWYLEVWVYKVPLSQEAPLPAYVETTPLSLHD